MSLFSGRGDVFHSGVLQDLNMFQTLFVCFTHRFPTYHGGFWWTIINHHWENRKGLSQHYAIRSPRRLSPRVLTSLLRSTRPAVGTENPSMRRDGHEETIKWWAADACGRPNEGFVKFVFCLSPYVSDGPEKVRENLLAFWEEHPPRKCEKIFWLFGKNIRSTIESSFTPSTYLSIYLI